MPHVATMTMTVLYGLFLGRPKQNSTYGRRGTKTDKDVDSRSLGEPKTAKSPKSHTLTWLMAAQMESTLQLIFLLSIYSHTYQDHVKLGTELYTTLERM